MQSAHVRLGSHEYVVDLTQVIRRPTATLTQQQDQGARKGEQSLDGGGIWKRTSSDFRLGMGQQYFDQEDENDARRHYWSYGVDTVTDPRAVRLMPTPVVAVGPYASAPYSYVERVIGTNNGAYLMTYSSVYRVATNLASATAITGWTGTPQDIAYFGGSIYIATTTGVFSGPTTGSTVTSFSANPATVITATWGRLVCANGRELFELQSTGTKVSIHTHGDTTWTWRAICAGSQGVYVAGGNAVQSEILLSTLLDITGAFAPPFPVAQIPSSEAISRMAFFGGILVVGSNAGARIMQASQQGFLQYGPLMAVGDVRGVAFSGRMAYLACDNTALIGGGGSVVQLDLSRFSAPLTPVYCIPYPATTSFVKDVALVNGVLLFIANASANTTLMRTNGTSYQPGVLDTGKITYGTPEPKQVVAAEARFDALPSGGSVTLGIYDEDGVLIASNVEATVGATEITVEVDALLTEEISLRLTLAGAAVVVRRWTLRSVVAPAYVPEEILLPLQLAQETMGDDGQIIQVRPKDEWDYLQSLSATRVRTTFAFGDDETECWVDQVGVNTGGWYRWNQTEGDWPDGVVMVRLLTVGS